MFHDSQLMADTRMNMASGNGPWQTIAGELQASASHSAAQGPWSVAFHRSPVEGIGRHDYYSEAPYWWPDPDNPDGPFIRRDGEYYPQRFLGHRRSIAHMSWAVLNLCQAGYYLQEKPYLERAAQLIQVWFLDPDTRMNPHLEYGQAIRGVCTGRGAGIIDLRYISRVVHGLSYLEEYPEYAPILGGMREWGAQLLQWLIASGKGIQESRSGNNHGTWYWLTAAVFAGLTSNEDVLEQTFDRFRRQLIPEQMTREGAFPAECARTKSKHYSLFNLQALSLICELARKSDIDLWGYRTPEGKGMELAVRFMLPYMNNPESWPYPDLDQDPPDEQLSFQLAAIRLDMPECAVVNTLRRKEGTRIRKQGMPGPLIFLPGRQA